MRGRPELQVLALYLASSPHQTITGIYRLTIPYVVADTGLTAQAVEQGLVDLEYLGYIRWDPQHELVWVVEQARHELGDSPSVQQRKGLAKGIGDLPESPVVAGFVERYADILDGRGYPTDTLSVAYRSQEQEQEQGQEQEQEQDSESSAPAADAKPPAPSEPAVLEYPTVGKVQTWQLSEAQVAEWAALFPDLDVLAECRSALAWVKANPGRRKTARGMARFLAGWLMRSNDRGGARRNGGPAVRRGLGEITATPEHVQQLEGAFARKIAAARKLDRAAAKGGVS